jgi:alkylhydroperoxidase family enzyme
MSEPRVPQAELTGPLGYLIKRSTKKMVGEVPDAVGVAWHNRKVLMTMMQAGRRAERWHEVPTELKTYAHMAVASLIGCSFCLDFGYFKAHDEHLDLAKASQVPRWRSSEVFTDLERDVMAYAEAMSQTPIEVTDELSARLLGELGEAGMLELTAWIAFANLTARNNVALGIEAAGFSKVCELPLATRDATTTADQVLTSA